MSFSTGASELPHAWRAEVLAQPPLIAPARQFIYPQQIEGEEDALARGALRLLVHPAGGSQQGGTFLATFALGFTDPSMPAGVFSCPNPRELCAVAGGYAYILDTTAPERSTLVPMKPVVQVLTLASHGLLVFVGFHAMLAWGSDELAWQTERLSWEGLRLTGVDGDVLRGFGWNLMTDKEVEFSVELRTGAHTGGGFQS